MPKPVERPKLDATMLDGVEGLAETPPETKAQLAELARMEVVTAGEAVSGFALALVLEGEASVCSTEGANVLRVGPRELVASHGTLPDVVALKLVAASAGARFAVWEQEAVRAALDACPWVVEELAGAADRLNALASAIRGDIGTLSVGARARLYELLSVFVAKPGDTLTSDATPVAVVCSGSVQVPEGAEGMTVGAGSVLFPRAEAQAALVGTEGVVLLVGDGGALAELGNESPSVAMLFRRG
jgi:hypothetical protein